MDGMEMDRNEGPTNGGTGEERLMVYAGFWRRLPAGVVDALVVLCFWYLRRAIESG